MSFYTIPEVGQHLNWAAAAPATALRFTPDSIVLLHFTGEDASLSAWTKGQVTLGITSPLPCIPVIAAQVGLQDAIAAPACIFELGPMAAMTQWLGRERLVPVPAEITLVLLRPNGQPDQAEVVAIRAVGNVEELLSSLRGQLEDQLVEFGEEDAAFAQQAGRQLLVDNDPEVFLFEAWPPVHEESK
jgi:hypothetical protein